MQTITRLNNGFISVTIPLIHTALNTTPSTCDLRRSSSGRTVYPGRTLTRDCFAPMCHRQRAVQNCSPPLGLPCRSAICECLAQRRQATGGSGNVNLPYPTQPRAGQWYHCLAYQWVPTIRPHDFKGIEAAGKPPGTRRFIAGKSWWTCPGISKGLRSRRSNCPARPVNYCGPPHTHQHVSVCRLLIGERALGLPQF